MDNILGRKIIEYRKKNKLTQRDLAKKLYVTNTTVSRWELGVTVPNSEQLLDIAALFGESVDSLLGNEKKPVANEAKPKDKDKILTIIVAWVLIVIAVATMASVIYLIVDENKIPDSSDVEPDPSYPDYYEVTDKFEAEWAEMNALSAAYDFYGCVEESEYASNGMCIAQYGNSFNVLLFKINSSIECKAKMYIAVVSLYDMTNNAYKETEFDEVWNLYVNPTKDDLNNGNFIKTGKTYISTDPKKTWYDFVEVQTEVTLKQGMNEIYFVVPLGQNGTVGLNMDYVRFECESELKWIPTKTNDVRPPDDVIEKKQQLKGAIIVF